MSEESEDHETNAFDVRLADIRAAVMLRESGSMSFEASIETALAEVAAEMKVGRSDVIRLALNEWLAMRQRAPLE
ncbi:hypothetical protein [Mesorhizobium captivum]|uniref:hypothetical protein n=1 Tax=Mesorhizobium captivum TaxID=3072319 RepID=UPI002A24D697|nr:hypothetical protein [Mesorhizobium sp. VK3C]MDX8450316.1 hypothetical protein [Mesorhizobium sp. VK3C]